MSILRGAVRTLTESTPHLKTDSQTQRIVTQLMHPTLAKCHLRGALGLDPPLDHGCCSSNTTLHTLLMHFYYHINFVSVSPLSWFMNSLNAVNCAVTVKVFGGKDRNNFRKLYASVRLMCTDVTGDGAHYAPLRVCENWNFSPLNSLSVKELENLRTPAAVWRYHSVLQQQQQQQPVLPKAAHRETVENFDTYCEYRGHFVQSYCETLLRKAATFGV
jgi:hypothetical protein